MDLQTNNFIKKDSMVGSFFEDVENNYKFLKELGAGAFGKVYEAEHRVTKKKYAIKRLSKKKIKDKDSIISEINLLKRLDHPGIVKLFEVYEDKVYIFLVMEELKGGELFDRILSRAQANNYYSEKQVAALFKQVLSSVSYCHDYKIVHRDIKPENIVFLDESDDSPVKLIDFGLSKSFEGGKNCDMKTRVGTCFYMSPEVVQGEYDEKCDVWSLGVLLYVLISGRAPFNGADDSQIIKKIVEGKLEFKWAGWSNISDDCKNLISSILVPAANRPSASEVLQHYWVTELAPQGTDIPISIEIDDFKKYGQLDKLNKALLGFIAFRLTEEEVKELKELFQTFDKDGNGTLTVTELQYGFETMHKTKGLSITPEELNEIFQAIDLDKNGVINYNEFIAATFDRQKQNTKENIYQAFKTFDVDQSGNLSLKELKNIIIAKNPKDEEEVNNLFKKLDIDNNGEIDFNEFLNYFE